ncbi:antibiotic biosynthesis monooxygenase [Streptomyces sp. NPDC052012]|uniref:antibiotic biosynthesis monooxygenase n=1 Tax=Streptomyces sp. NPDC052012 TaxID=3155051 RepID=UPI00344E9925
MPVRDLDGPVTVVNRFEVKDDIAEFEREFRAHSQFLRRRAGFDFLVTVRLVDDPRVYVHLGHWRSLRGFLDTVHDDTFTEQVRRLGAKVHTVADQAVSVRRILHEPTAVGSAGVVLLRARARGECAELEKRFALLGDRCQETGGFGGSDLLRSTIRPLSYTGVLWWRDTGTCARTLSGEGWQQSLDALRETADLTVEHSRLVAYERAHERD